MSNEEEQEEDEADDVSLKNSLAGGITGLTGLTGANASNLVCQDRQLQHCYQRPRERFQSSVYGGQNVGITKSLEAEAEAEAAELQLDEVFVTLMRAEAEAGYCFCPRNNLERREAEKKKRLKKCRSLPTSIHQTGLQYLNENSKDMTVQLNVSADVKISAGGQLCCLSLKALHSYAENC